MITVSFIPNNTESKYGRTPKIIFIVKLEDLKDFIFEQYSIYSVRAFNIEIVEL